MKRRPSDSDRRQYEATMADLSRRSDTGCRSSARRLVNAVIAHWELHHNGWPIQEVARREPAIADIYRAALGDE